MQLSELVRRLNSGPFDSVHFMNELKSVHAYSLLNWEQAFFMPDCLYIGPVSLLPATPPVQEINLICIEDVQLPQAYLEAGHLNLARIAGSALSHYELFHAVSAIMGEEVQIALNMQKLFDASYSNLGLQYLIQAASDVFGRPMLLNDTKFMILALSEGVPDAVALSETASGEKYLDASIISFIQDNHFLGRLRNSELSYYEKKSNDLHGTLVSLVHIQGIEVAQLVLFEAGKPFNQSDIRLIEHFGKLLSTELQKNDFFNIGKNFMPNFFLRDLLDKRVNDEEVVEAQLNYLKWAKHETYHIMTIAHEENDAFERKAPFIVHSLQSFIPSGRFIIYKTGLVVFMDREISAAILGKSNTAFIEYLHVNALIAGVSLPFKKLSESRKYYVQALKAGEYAQRKHLDFCLYEKHMLNFLAELIVAEKDIADFCHPAVIKLREEDRNHGTAFVETLKYYLYYTDSPNEAAKALNIHRNTLFYRINKIKQLADITLENGDERFQIYFSIQLLN
ncbi:PucR family transcriptional regulator [Paenibacillus radicis (ex Gao et al. 2016)]|uniref:PucR C-terminal helix-turn-helix domain-containing protein n=1 Tax=Paenibacillus radicis (ex Gao et al. 2016) TaxID=1737354 RepID=A0A917M9E4_9BACL|nr:helix-turn-helix domain-containing protein [Paenibacillus radicis (ex Gao et al. 2016)]GGG85848.1 hypothetical protein GCM10010918_49900 [Paenibacillus radicis (ex Gao et al. 2016)]